jgi:dipeptidyl aminopeptidase/acylaminoacyl peptidase
MIRTAWWPVRRIFRPIRPTRGWLAAGILLGMQFLAAAGLAGDAFLAPRHVARLHTVLSAEVSPDGACVAYTRAVPRQPLQGENGPAWVELHVVDAQGKSRPFITGAVNVSGVRWMPDGRSLAFLAKRGSDTVNSLYAIPIDGGEARRVMAFEADLQAANFSADGHRIALLAAEPLAKEQKDYRDQGFNQEIYEEDWRPVKVWIAEASGAGKPRMLELPGSASAVEWSPSGRQLAVVLAPTALVDDSYMFKRVCIVDVDTGRVVERIQNPGKLGRVAWSPDGKHLAMISGADLSDPADGRLMVAAIPGDGSVRDLMPAYQAHVSAFVWKDAQTLVWVAEDGTATTLGHVRLDGGREIINGPGTPILTGLSLSQDGRTLAFPGQSPEHPTEVFLQGPNDKSPRRLTNSNPWLADLRLARQEVMTWKARDGLSLEGILTYPLNYEPGRRYPLILYVHGGPEAHVSHGWTTSYSSPGQVAAARGFAVFCPNYRGSTGRGVEFSKLGQADAAGREFDDLVDAVDHLVAAGIADKAKVGITGGSYGGYASAWAATYYSDRFAASVMFVGISDNVSKLGTTDIPEEMYLVHHRKRLWEDWTYFLERSPIYYVQRHRTPLLILHGKEDPRVDPSQSLELYRHLKTLDQAPVRLVLYPGEGHGNRRAAARFDYHVRMLQWMEHYLQGPGGEPPAQAIDYTAAWGDEG